MRKSWAVLLAMILVLPSVASSAQKIEDIPWDESHIKTLRASGKAAAFRFFIRQEDPDNEMESTESSLDFGFDWYPAGEGKYELAINSQSGPDIAHLDIYWRDAPGKFRSQNFGILAFARTEKWYEGPEFADLNGDGKDELILFEPLDSDDSANLFRRKFVPNATWPKVYRLRDGKYVDASRDFADFYLNKILPQLNKAIVKAANANAPPWSDPSDNDWQLPDRNLAALIMCRDTILRVIGRDPTAGLAQARKWMRDSDPVMVDDARIVFQDLGGHDEEVRAAKLATDRASENWPNKNW
jgi:hypothetical protein